MDIECIAENFPLHELIRIDDHFNQKSAYIQFHKAQFQFNQFSQGTKTERQNHNITKDLKKYFSKRKFLFSLFDEGIQIDRQSWYSVIAEPISLYLLEQLKYYGIKTIMEPFCGVGGLAIHLCDGFEQYYANDIDEEKIKMLRNNLSVYGKGLNHIKIKNKDIFDVQPFKVDAIIVCPPWGGLSLEQYAFKDLDELMNPPLSKILLHCARFSENMMLQMPKNTNINNLIKTINMCFLKPIIRIQKICVNESLSQLFIYLGSQAFLHMNPSIYEAILRDSGKDIFQTGIKKQQKKALKQNLKGGEYQIFQQVYEVQSKKKHIFFDS